MPKILSEKVIYDDRYQIEEATIKSGKKKFSRQRINRQEAAVVLVLNKDSNKVVLTRQFRYAIAAKTKTPILEIVAGKLDKNEAPLKAALRETEEEIGFKIKKKNIRPLFSLFVSPGYTSEKFHFFYAEVRDADRRGKGGGLEEEDEEIEVVELDADEFLAMIKQGKIEDAKTCLAGMHLLWMREKEKNRSRKK